MSDAASILHHMQSLEIENELSLETSCLFKQTLNFSTCLDLLNYHRQCNYQVLRKDIIGSLKLLNNAKQNMRATS